MKRRFQMIYNMKKILYYLQHGRKWFDRIFMYRILSIVLFLIVIFGLHFLTAFSDRFLDHRTPLLFTASNWCTAKKNKKYIHYTSCDGWCPLYNGIPMMGYPLYYRLLLVLIGFDVLPHLSNNCCPTFQSGFGFNWNITRRQRRRRICWTRSSFEGNYPFVKNGYDNDDDDDDNNTTMMRGEPHARCIKLRRSTSIDKLPDRMQPLQKILPLKNSVYSVTEALYLLKTKLGITCKKTESIEVHVKLNVDPRRTDYIIRGIVRFPHIVYLTNRFVVVAAASTQLQHEATTAGADWVGDDQLIDHLRQTFLLQGVENEFGFVSKMKKSNTTTTTTNNGGGEQQKSPIVHFDIFICAPDIMAKVGTLGKYLGPIGKLPTPRLGTVTANIGEAVSLYKSRKVSQYRCDRYGNIHLMLGPTTHTLQQLTENFWAAIDTLRSAKPKTRITLAGDKSKGGGRGGGGGGSKGVNSVLEEDKFLEGVVVSSTYGPGLKINTAITKKRRIT